MKKTIKLAGLYLITPDLNDSAQLIQQVDAALRGGARLLQYRNKLADKTLQLEQARALRTLCQHYQAVLIINDNPELAAACKADGVHLGQSDAGISAARALLGPEALIGATCHNSLELAATAAAQGADYLSFGRFFPSHTKPQALAADLAILSLAKQRFALPIAAIGGINAENAALIMAAGADLLASCAAVFGQTAITATTRTLQTRISHSNRAFISQTDLI